MFNNSDSYSPMKAKKHQTDVHGIHVHEPSDIVLFASSYSICQLLSLTDLTAYCNNEQWTSS